MRLLFCFAVFASFLLPSPAIPADAVPRPSRKTIDIWQDRKFGMFIHFGLFSIPAGNWKGKESSNNAEQIMGYGHIPVEEYSQLAKQFNPQQWDPDAIVTLAKQAGMRFIVLTSKHHDGFSMFGTKASDYNVVDASPYRKDIVKSLADACRRQNMPFGVYYSIIDWHFPGGSGPEPGNNNLIPPAHADFNVRQIDELMSNYGPLAEVWFDMGRPTPEQSKRFADAVHRRQPECLVSGRVWNEQGDFVVLGDNHLPDHPIEQPWETPMSAYFNEDFGYRASEDRSDLQGHINEHIQKLVAVASRGGNYLLNIGPKGDGSVVPFESDLLHAMGKWLQQNGEAIYGTSPEPFRELDFGYATTKGNRLYLLVTKWPDNNRFTLPGLQNRIKRAYYLADASQVPLTVDDSAKSVTASRRRETAPVTVLVTELEGTPRVIPPTIHPDGQGVLTLAREQSTDYYNYNGNDYSAPRSVYKQRWDMTVAKTGKYKVEAHFRNGVAGQPVEFRIGGHVLRSKIPSADGLLTVGTVALKAEPDVILTGSPREPRQRGEKLGAEFYNLTLTPAP